MRKADRLFQVVNLIRTCQPITAAALAERVGVSVRTIYRYIDDLSVSGIPIYGEPGVGYAVDDGFELPPLALTAGELEALMLAVEMLARATGEELAGAARTLLGKIQAAAPGHGVDPAQAAARDFSRGLTAAERTHWDTLCRAVRRGQALTMRYLSLAERVSERTIFPLGLFHWGGKWTVGAWCCLRSAYRDFRVDRIESLTVAGDVVHPEAGISLAGYMRERSDTRRDTPCPD
ncbi:helix-turn-helix transcriptional regulator [Arhodomonas sp. AD133]|uniref:helix-turn-helix transcriptional regulator n=1 Tax=Arhodomonas sp. AD133 TaxID=3415009 RepID=UPI003EB9EAA4